MERNSKAGETNTTATTTTPTATATTFQQQNAPEISPLLANDIFTQSFFIIRSTLVPHSCVAQDEDQRVQQRRKSLRLIKQKNSSSTELSSNRRKRLKAHASMKKLYQQLLLVKRNLSKALKNYPWALFSAQAGSYFCHPSFPNLLNFIFEGSRHSLLQIYFQLLLYLLL